MRQVAFEELADYLRHGREIEFAYRGRQYSITNHSGYWYLCDDTDHVCLETLCRFEEKEILVAKIAAAVVGGMTIREVFDRHLYDEKGVDIL